METNHQQVLSEVFSSIDFPRLEMDVDLESQMHFMIECLNESYKKGKREVVKRFTATEVIFLYESLLSLEYTPQFGNKDSIEISCKTNHIFNPYHARVDLDQLVIKLDQLTEFQAFTIIMMVREISQKAKPQEDFTKQLFDAFQPLEDIN
jgi:hypothetical protein